MERYYICIDLKSFYASVECVERKLDPFTTNLVVADPMRSKSTICLAITPAMKKLGVKIGAGSMRSRRISPISLPCRGCNYIWTTPHGSIASTCGISQKRTSMCTVWMSASWT